ncbi:hypothetical protein BDN72DRAFT_277928 [Pluteus cervinus]|uniref:Uncharacterized protein n=1 Tax=Pluteus cervinus TaxID=181527 RepID=A0ACD3AET1_9AGAR|nr:hypothetical protein BDN72DRAFT_277928 [Pluteus cervinus]
MHRAAYSYHKHHRSRPGQPQRFALSNLKCDNPPFSSLTSDRVVLYLVRRPRCFHGLLQAASVSAYNQLHAEFTYRQVLLFGLACVEIDCPLSLPLSIDDIEGNTPALPGKFTGTDKTITYVYDIKFKCQILSVVSTCPGLFERQRTPQNVDDGSKLIWVVYVISPTASVVAGVRLYISSGFFVTTPVSEQ